MPPLTSWFYSWISSRCASSLRWQWCCYWKVSVWTSEQELQEVVKKKQRIFTWSRTPQRPNISACRENDVGPCEYNILLCLWQTRHVHTLTCTGLFFLLPYPCNLSHIVRRKSTLTQGPIIVFQETQGEMGRETKRGPPGVQCGSSRTANLWQTASHRWRESRLKKKWELILTKRFTRCDIKSLSIPLSKVLLLNLLMQSRFAFATSKLFISVTRYRRGVLTHVFVCSVSCLFLFFYY